MMKAHYIRDNFWPLHLALFHEIFAFLISENFAGNPSSEALDPCIIGSVPLSSKTLKGIFEIKKIEIFIPFEVWEIAVLLAG